MRLVVVLVLLLAGCAPGSKEIRDCYQVCKSVCCLTNELSQCKQACKESLGKANREEAICSRSCLPLGDDE